MIKEEKLPKPIFIPSWWDNIMGIEVRSTVLYTWLDLALEIADAEQQVEWVSVPRRKNGSPDMRYRVNKDAYGK